ncbi:MAG TPA: sugar ABC transporter permease [Tepidisphaeraceae bacterium]
MPNTQSPDSSLTNSAAISAVALPDALSEPIAFQRVRRKWHDTDTARFWFMMTPALLGFIIFAAGPMLTSLYLSFTKYDVLSSPQWIGISNYTYLLRHDPAFWPSVKVTAIFAGCSVPLLLLIALSIAILLNQDFFARNIFRTIFFLPALLPAAASAVVWVWIFDPTRGLLNHALALVGIAGPAWMHSTTWALPALIIISLWGFGRAMVIFLAGLQEVPRQLYEAAQIDGAGPLHRFYHVTLPMISPVLFFNLVIGIIDALKAFDLAFVSSTSASVGAGGPARATLLYTLNLYQKSFQYFHMGLGSAMAWLLFLVILLLTAINFALEKRWVHTS